MKKDLLCTWLGLPKASWPPDPWTLLGVPRDVRDLGVIEQRVQDRMTTLRQYQLSFPEEATEGMNRLAEAYIVLAEANQKAATASKEETSVLLQTKTDWQAEPPPVRNGQAVKTAVQVDEPDEPDEPVLEHDADATDVLVAKPFVAPTKPARRSLDPTLARELGQESEEATSALGTLEAVIERVEITRKLLHAWDKVGKLLRPSPKKVSTKESDYFARRLREISDVMATYPGFVGQPGKPGYRVVVLARLRIPLLIARAMSDEQREELLVDWEAGRQVLLQHRKFLHRHFKTLRRRTAVGLFLHAVRSMVNDYPLQTLIGVAVGLVLALFGGWAYWGR